MKLGSIAAVHPAVRIGSYPNTSIGQGASENVPNGAYKVGGGDLSQAAPALAGFHTCACITVWRRMAPLVKSLHRAAAAQREGAQASHPSSAQFNLHLLLPCSNANHPQVKLQFESRDAAALQQAVEAAREQLDTFVLAKPR